MGQSGRERSCHFSATSLSPVAHHLKRSALGLLERMYQESLRGSREWVALRAHPPVVQGRCGSLQAGPQAHQHTGGVQLTGLPTWVLGVFWRSRAPHPSFCFVPAGSAHSGLVLSGKGTPPPTRATKSRHKRESQSLCVDSERFITVWT